MALNDYKSSLNGVLHDSTYSEFNAHEWNHGKVVPLINCVAEEVPVALEYNRVSHAVMLASPQDLKDFATGFSLTEGVIQQPDDIHNIEILMSDTGITIRLTIASACFRELNKRRRTLAGKTGCGLCGVESLEQLYQHPQTVTSTVHYSVGALQKGFEELNKNQQLKQYTGATHAAAWLNQEGQLMLIREDVGRHNALDKLLGALARRNFDLSQGAVLITSRASYEMVQKSAVLGVGILAAISAPTGLAIRLAETAGLTLAGFVRGHRLTVYTHPDRFNA